MERDLPIALGQKGGLVGFLMGYLFGEELDVEIDGIEKRQS